MRSVRVVAAVLAALCAVVPIARADAPHATVSGSGIDVAALLSSGQEFCADHALFADAGWPPLGLSTAVPATAGQTLHIAFDGPATLSQADVTGLAAPVVTRPVAAMAQDSPSSWHVTMPPAPDPTGMALAFHADWASGDCHGDQYYAVALEAPAVVEHVRGRAGAARVTVLARAAVTVVATLRAHGARAGRLATRLPAGARRTLTVPAGHARRATLRLVITTADGGRTVVTRRIRLRA